ncbi:transglutaminase TgpA family protein [Tahibacter amnicola]|uniref:DUF3488 and transglutaminase-like domain-containing protein n=1 Tax=Tahibacter amnicola TaxID=2976241 RepID=A0ABY6BI05_9GAMM|nr:DUF3488 and transglutaminase-like domain-containing protein [Tahibacter amnicola]UXI69638.1 DUF3488 and transglutaminase-like domain-containing protein [Tahibacter amnicola]
MTRLDRRQFDALTFAVAVAVLSHAPHMPLWFNIGVALLMALRWWQRHTRPQWGAPPVWIRLPLSLALPAAVIAYYGNLFGREPGSALAVGMLVLKLGESEKPRDVRAAVTFSCFVLMASLLFAKTLVATIAVAAALLPQLVALRSLEPSGRAGEGEQAWPFWQELRRTLPSTVLTLLAAAPVALVAFLFLPRLAEPLWGAPAPGSSQTGPSDTMSPGSISELLIDDSPAFRVTFANSRPPAPEQRYWRGLVLWNYDGTTWTGMAPQALEKSAEKLVIQSDTLDYELTLEPTHRNWLFALDVPLIAPAGFLRTRDYSLIAGAPITQMRQYALRSVLDYQITALTPEQRHHALFLPPGFNPRTLALGEQWRNQFQDRMLIVQAALNLFNESFSYTLLPPPLGRNAMDDFLFDTRAGFCEHFSSAFTTLMRAAGVPARVVVGYQGGYWNPVGEYMVVRQSDAHAWTEVWLEDRGWIRVDPTASVSPDRVQLGSRAAAAGDAPWYGSEWLLGLRNRWDLVNQMWNRVVVQFDTLRQQGLLSRFGIERAEWTQLAVAFGILAALVIAIGLFWAFRPDPDRGDAIDRAWRRLCRRLARAGIQRAVHEGPQSYLDRIRQRSPVLAAEVESLVRRYITLRYATQQPAAPDVTAFRAQVDAFRPRRLSSGS